MFFEITGPRLLTETSALPYSSPCGIRTPYLQRAFVLIKGGGHIRQVALYNVR